MTTGESPNSPVDASLADTSTPDASGPVASSQAEAPAESPPTESKPPESKTQVTDAGAAKPARSGGPLAARGLGVAKPTSPSVSTEQLEAQDKANKGNKKSRSAPRPKLAGEKRDAPKPAEAVRAEGDVAVAVASPVARPKPGKVAVPSVRQDLDDELMAEFEASLSGDGLEDLLGEAAGMANRREPINDGTRISAIVLKIHSDSVFVSLGGPDEGTVPFEQFETEPEVGSSIELVVRGFNAADDLYICSLPHGAVDVSDWEDIQEGSVVEALVTATNTGGLEVKVGGVSGFIPISQITEYRVEDTSEFVDQKFLCVVTEANPRRNNLVLSRRAILERERESKRKEQLEEIQPGDLINGTVRSLKDFGAFVDLGGLDGLIHISKLSWERVKHPSDVMEVGQAVQVRVDTVDKESGKIGLSYRDLLENPWDTAEAEFAPGSVHKGTVTKIAAFGCFVRLAAGVEGLVHISELANHRVSNVDSVVTEGQEVEVKVLTFNRDDQKISLSVKQAIAGTAAASAPVEEDDTPPPEIAVKPQHAGPLKGGNNQDTGGERFGLKW